MKKSAPPKITPATLRGLELRCPPLPQTLLEATRLIDQPHRLEVRPVTEMVERDPIVVAKLLHIVNSAYYGLRRTINSVERTVVMLGPVAVAGIVVGMNILKLNSILEGPAGRCFDRLIQHSIATAFLLRHLLEGSPRQRRTSSRAGVSFTAGLLHDFGKIILVYNAPDEAVALYDEQTLKGQVRDPDVRNLEQLVFGCDHAEAGEYVARKLGFPDSLTEVIRRHHEPEESTGDLEIDRLIRATAAANLTAKAMGYALDCPIPWETVAADPIWELYFEQEQRSLEEVGVLIEELKQEQENLDQYVRAMTTRPELSENGQRPSKIKKRGMYGA